MENQKHVCSFCRTIGSRGAEWLLLVPGEADRKVHKPCGEKAIAYAPQGVKAKVVPSPELRARFETERSERDAKSFWAEKFAQAAARKSQQSAPAPQAAG